MHSFAYGGQVLPVKKQRIGSQLAQGNLVRSRQRCNIVGRRNQQCPQCGIGIFPLQRDTGTCECGANLQGGFESADSADIAESALCPLYRTGFQQQLDGFKAIGGCLRSGAVGGAVEQAFNFVGLLAQTDFFHGRNRGRGRGAAAAGCNNVGMTCSHGATRSTS